MPRKASVHSIAAFAAIFFCALLAGCNKKQGAGLRLTQTIPLAGVAGRIDHFAVDVVGSRLFVCALGNDSVEVIDLQKGERIHSIAGLGAPQGIAYIPESDRLYVANDKRGLCTIYDGKSFAPLGEIDFQDDADNVRYESATRQLYVGYGNGALGVVDGDAGQSVSSIKLSAHPEAFVLEKHGPRIFVNVPEARHVAVIDRIQGKVIATWNTGLAFANFPLALDEGNHRLFIGCRLPARLVVLNTDTGAVVTTIAISGDVDDVFYDESRHCLYAICGEGSVDQINQTDRDTYHVAGKTETAAGARTGLIVPELNSLFVAVPHRGSQQAEIRRYQLQ